VDARSSTGHLGVWLYVKIAGKRNGKANLSFRMSRAQEELTKGGRAGKAGSSELIWPAGGKSKLVDISVKLGRFGGRLKKWLLLGEWCALSRTVLLQSRKGLPKEKVAEKEHFPRGGGGVGVGGWGGGGQWHVTTGWWVRKERGIVLRQCWGGGIGGGGNEGTLIHFSV